MKKLIALCLVGLLCAVCAHSAFAKKKEQYRAPGGATINPIGISIEASYDPRLDGFVPGYKVINVAVVNQGFNIIYLDPEKDRWRIKLADEKKAVSAIHDLRGKDPTAWSKIPEKAKELVGYPLVLPIGAREVIDLFVPDSVNVEKFNELDVYLRIMNTEFEIMVRQ
jgi:hypothetical protein